MVVGVAMKIFIFLIKVSWKDNDYIDEHSLDHFSSMHASKSTPKPVWLRIIIYDVGMSGELKSIRAQAAI